MSLCLPLAGSTACPDFAGLSAFIPANIAAQVTFTSVTEFDNYIKATSDFSVGTSFYNALIGATYNCPGFDGTGFRYYQTANCANFVGQGIGAIADGATTPCNPVGTVMPICTSSINGFITAYAKVFGNTAVCPNGENSLAASIPQPLVSYIASNYFTTGGSCVVGEVAEAQNCGFRTAAEATKFCAADVTNDPCCPKKTTAAAAATNAPQATSQVAPPTTAGTGSSSSSGGISTNTIIYIGAGAGGSLLIIIAIVVYCCCIKKKAPPKSLDEFEKQNIPMQKVGSKANLQGAPMGVSQPPKGSNIHTAMFNYTAQMPDEINTLAGDKVAVKHEYDDGWGFGMNLRTRQEGSFPLDLLDGFGQEQMHHQQQPQQHSKRASSLYGPPAGMNQGFGNQNQGFKPVAIPVGVPLPGGPQQSQAGDVRKVVKPYNPTQNDEILLRVGDSVKVANEYEDGWGFGQNLSSGKQGLFPLVSLGPKQQQQQPQQPPQTPKQAPVVPSANDARKVIMEYQPSQSDEILLRVGDVVKVANEYDDGWGFGKNLTTNREGLFPLDVLAPKQGVVSANDKKHGQRLSSLQGPAPPQKPASDIVIVAEDFDPENPDEIELRVGDQVQLKKQFDDGWATGTNKVTGATGLFPLDCLVGFEDGKPKNGDKKHNQRVSSIYDADFSAYSAPVPAIPVPTPAKKEEKKATSDIAIVAEDFDPENPDEIELRIGDQVQLKKQYDDGWATGTNKVTGATGLFPLDCLAGFEDGKPKNGDKKHNQRVSSIYDADFSAYSAPVPAAPAPVPVPAKTVPAKKEEKKPASDIVIVAEDFDPENADEIELRIGDQVQLKKQYDDGWATGTNKITGATGLFPLDCLVGFEDGKPKNGDKKHNQRVSSIYDADFSAYSAPVPAAPAPAPVAAAAPKKDGILIVQYDFDPENPDEIELRVGDQIQLKKQYDDGWATGLNLSTGASGLFPQDCLPGFGQVVTDEKGNKKNKARASSFYDGYSSSAPVPAVAAPVPAKDAGGIQKAVFDFPPSQSDEINIKAGDKIQILQAYDDGWAFGKNLSSGKEGLFPLDVLPAANNAGGNIGNKNRTSSLYGMDSYYNQGGPAYGKY